MSAPIKSPFFNFAFALPEYLVRGADAAYGLRGLSQQSDIENIIILGMGVGRLAGRAVRALSSRIISVPILVVSTYEIPACVGTRSLIFAVSGSGHTEEVYCAAMACAKLGAKLVVVSNDGQLVSLAQESGAPLLRIPHEIRPARVTFGFLLASILATLEVVGFLPEVKIWVKSAVLQMRRRRKELSQERNFAEYLARSLLGRHVLCEGDNPIGATAAERWKTQINQNARQLASFSEQPNASHNESIALDCRNELNTQHHALALLRHRYEDPRVSKRIDMLAQCLRGKMPIYSVHGEGETPFAALMDLIMIGDFTSVHLAELNGVDPHLAQLFP